MEKFTRNKFKNWTLCICEDFLEVFGISINFSTTRSRQNGPRPCWVWAFVVLLPLRALKAACNLVWCNLYQFLIIHSFIHSFHWWWNIVMTTIMVISDWHDVRSYKYRQQQFEVRAWLFQLRKRQIHLSSKTYKEHVDRCPCRSGRGAFRTGKTCIVLKHIEVVNLTRDVLQNVLQKTIKTYSSASLGRKARRFMTTLAV